MTEQTITGTPKTIRKTRRVFAIDARPGDILAVHLPDPQYPNDDDDVVIGTVTHVHHNQEPRTTTLTFTYHYNNDNGEPGQITRTYRNLHSLTHIGTTPTD